MSSGFNSEQINRLNSLGIEVGMGKVGQRQSSVWYLAPVVGLGLAGFGFAVALSNKGNQSSVYVEIKQTDGSVVARVSPTKTSGSVQQYLLSSQQYFSQAMQVQSSGGNNQEVVDYLNKSLTDAGLAINNFPNDFRGWQQRGKIYQSLIKQDSPLSEQDASFLKQAIVDLSKAYRINADSAEVNRSLANLHARAGDGSKTIFYLSETIRIEPTKAQNFYDLAKIQSQSGHVVGALETYKQLIWLVSDKGQKEVLEREKIALEKILADNPDLENQQTRLLRPSPTDMIERDGPTIRAGRDDGVVIASFEERADLKVDGMTESNSMSGVAILASGQSDVEIKNNNIADASQIYVSAIKGGKNQVLRVKSRSDLSFRVGLDLPINEEIEFRWWVVD